MEKETKTKISKSIKSKGQIFSLRFKILIPMLLVLILSITFISTYSYFNQKSIIEQQMAMITDNKVEEIIGGIHNSEASIETLKQGLNNNYLKQAKLIAQLIAQNPALLETEAITKLANDVGVEEICVIDENGFIQWSNITSFYGFDCNASEQTKPFLAGINDKSFELAQEPSIRGTDGSYFQYIGVSRIDGLGVVQIGVQPKELEQIVDKNDIQTVVSNVKIGEQSQVLILDKDGRYTAHTNIEEIGQNVSEFDWGEEILSNKNGNITYRHDEIEKFATYKEHDGEIIVVSVDTKDFMSPLEGLKRTIAISAIISILVSILIIFIISNKFIVKSINDIMKLMGKAEKGDFSIRSSNTQRDEIGNLSNSFNKMINDFGNLVKGIKAISSQVSAFSSDLTNASETTSEIGEQVTNAVEEVAKGATDQAKDAEQVLQLTVHLSTQIDAISERSNNMNEEIKHSENLNIQGVDIVNELLSSSEESNKYMMEAFNVITELDKKSNTIFNIIQIINGISEQTNLLALNAAIEAARAGDAGKGFSVVANEIRNLADQSKQSTKQIEEIINAITNDIGKASGNMSSVKDKLEKQSIIAGETDDILKQIRELIQGINKDIEDVNESILSVGSSKNEIVISMQNISAITEETAAASQQVSASAQEYRASSEQVSGIARQLNDIVVKLDEKFNQFNV